MLRPSPGGDRTQESQGGQGRITASFVFHVDVVTNKAIRVGVCWNCFLIFLDDVMSKTQETFWSLEMAEGSSCYFAVLLKYCIILYLFKTLLYKTCGHQIGIDVWKFMCLLVNHWHFDALGGLNIVNSESVSVSGFVQLSCQCRRARFVKRWRPIRMGGGPQKSAFPKSVRDSVVGPNGNSLSV